MRLIVVLSILLASCVSSLPEEKTGEVSEILGVIYDAKASRVNSSSPWYLISGKFSLVFEQAGGDTGPGIFSYDSYYEPQFCGAGQTCECTGIFEFDYVASEAEAPSDTIVDGPYNVFDPYDTEPTTTPTPSNTPVPKQVYAYSFVLTERDKAMSEYCLTQTSRTIGVIRFQSEEIIIQDGHREVLFRKR